MGRGPFLLHVHEASHWRPLVEDIVGDVWPELADGPVWITAQVHAESLGDPDAVSPAGAQGLLQLMPATARELGVADPFEPFQNLTGGVTYLRRQFESLGEVPDDVDRLMWAFASYNCGRGYVRRALAVAKADAYLAEPWNWAEWNRAWRYLAHRRADHRGRWADYHQVVDYVARIRRTAALQGVPR